MIKFLNQLSIESVNLSFFLTLQEIELIEATIFSWSSSLEWAPSLCRPKIIVHILCEFACNGQRLTLSFFLFCPIDFKVLDFFSWRHVKVPRLVPHLNFIIQASSNTEGRITVLQEQNSSDRKVKYIYAKWNQVIITW